MSQSPKLRVAICGGGIGGLALAVALTRSPAKSKIHVDVYEAASTFEEIGAGIMMWERTWRILELLGLGEELGKVANTIPDGSPGIGFEFRRSDVPKGFHFHTHSVPYGCIRFHRAHFLDVFVRALPPGIAHFGKRLFSYTSTPSSSPFSKEVQLHFSDGTTATCDLLVGADGLKSIVRAQMYTELADEQSAKTKDSHPDSGQYLKELIDPVWSGWVVYRSLIPLERLRNAAQAKGRDMGKIMTPMIWCGKSKHLVSYPIAQSTIFNFVGFVFYPEGEGAKSDGPWVTDVSGDEVRQHYVGWETEVQDILEHVDGASRWMMMHLKPLPNYSKGGVTLLGDAAHAMTPHAGAGAGQAIEDAYILSHLLTHPHTTRKTLSAALAAYDYVRIPFCNHVLRASRENGKMYEFNSLYEEEYNELGDRLDAQWEWLWWRTPEEEAERAVKVMLGKIQKDTSSIAHAKL
ncbi:FAD/NAD-P-binding domain-containing protein [Panus rudis PR-1116 ss-1]|nr:FAD/NAD-P-binding domain-containing protein [Panus rudis PR-1116 ss-1]KAI0072445.1 FAD/NAD-P-binding domain-containing protein [Panus rudis PR-1116 ss-1]